MSNDLSQQGAVPPTPTIPYGFCHCGCGRPTPIATQTSRRRGHIKGRPLNFIKPHNGRLPRRRTLEPNPDGFCQCGCGREAPLAVKTSKRRGVVQGCHALFCVGHGNKLPPALPVNPTGICQCGCGGAVSRNLETNKRRGVRGGEFNRFILGHSQANPVGHIPGHYTIEQLSYPTPCWVWARSKDVDGYGRHSARGSKQKHAHRYYYEIFKGPIPRGFHVDHLCVNPACVNPDHLEAVRPEVNEQRKRARIRELVRMREIRKARRYSLPLALSAEAAAM